MQMFGKEFKLGHVALGAGLVLAGSAAIFLWWRKRSAAASPVPNSLITANAPGPITGQTRLDVSTGGSPSDVSPDLESGEDFLTVQGQPGGSNTAAGAGPSVVVNDEIPSVFPPEETEDEPFNVAVAEIGPKIDSYTDITQLVSTLEAAEAKKTGFPTALDSWVQGHIAGLDQENLIRGVLEGKV